MFKIKYFYGKRQHKWVTYKETECKLMTTKINVYNIMGIFSNDKK